MPLNILIRFSCLMFIPVLMVSGCNILDRSKERVVITVGERSITEDELKKDVQQIVVEMGIPDQETKLNIEPIINKIIEKSLIMEYGKEEEILLSEQELESAIVDIKRDYPADTFQKMLLQRYINFDEWKESLRQELLIKKIILAAAAGMSPITFNETKAYFDSHRDEFWRNRMIQLSQIVTNSREEAERILVFIRKGEEMGELAKKHSITPEAQNNGMLGWIAKGELEESMDKMVFSLPVGKVSPVFKSPYGYHIFKVLSIRKEGLKDLPEVMAEIESRLMLRKRELFYGEWIEELKGRFPVSREREILKGWNMKG